MIRLLLAILLISSTCDAQNDCSVIERTVDKFTGKTTLRTPLLEYVSYTKILNQGKTSYYLSLYTWGSTLETRGRGVTLLLEGGKRISKPAAKIDVEAGSDTWKYSAWVPLTATDIALLKAKKVTDYRLYIFDNELEQADRDREIDWFNCLILSK